MTRVMLVALFFVGVLVFQSPAPLSRSDFVLRGLTYGTDPQTVRNTLGLPDSTRAGRPDEGDCWYHWFYRDLTVNFPSEHGPVLDFNLTGPSKTTRRGLRIGDRAERVQLLYGEASSTAGGYWVYPLGTDSSVQLVVALDAFQRVRAVTFGRLLDCD